MKRKFGHFWKAFCRAFNLLDFQKINLKLRNKLMTRAREENLPVAVKNPFDESSSKYLSWQANFPLKTRITTFQFLFVNKLILPRTCYSVFYDFITFAWSWERVPRFSAFYIRPIYCRSLGRKYFVYKRINLEAPITVTVQVPSKNLKLSNYWNEILQSAARFDGRHK